MFLEDRYNVMKLLQICEFQLIRLQLSIINHNKVLNSCLVVQKFKVALITIGLIVNLLATLVPLKKTVFLNKQTRFERFSFRPCQKSTRE